MNSTRLPTFNGLRDTLTYEDQNAKLGTDLAAAQAYLSERLISASAVDKLLSFAEWMLEFRRPPEVTHPCYLEMTLPPSRNRSTRQNVWAESASCRWPSVGFSLKGWPRPVGAKGRSQTSLNVRLNVSRIEEWSRGFARYW
jgi:hypothetical protein